MLTVDCYRRWRHAIALLLLLPASTLAADTQRFEQDLQQAWGDEVEVTIGEISSAFLRSRLTAEDISAIHPEKNLRLGVDRYTVQGDYAAPDTVTLEGVRLHHTTMDKVATGTPLLTLDRMLYSQPAKAVFSIQDLGQGDEKSSIAMERLTLDTLVLQKINLGDAGVGSVTLEAAMLENLRRSADTDSLRVDAMTVQALAIDAERFSGQLAALEVQSDFIHGEGGLILDGVDIDLAPTIAQAAPDQRPQLRMLSNVLTGGSGRLQMDAAMTGQWQEDDAHTLVTSTGKITLHDAMGLSLNLHLPMQVPDDVTPEAIFSGEQAINTAWLLGGNLTLTLEERGLLERLVTLNAALQGVSKAQYIEQARTQAEGLGMLFGPGAQQFLLGLVRLAEGAASTLTLTSQLPAGSGLEAGTSDIAGLVGTLSLQVDVE